MVRAITVLLTATTNGSLFTVQLAGHGMRLLKYALAVVIGRLEVLRINFSKSIQVIPPINIARNIHHIFEIFPTARRLRALFSLSFLPAPKESDAFIHFVSFYRIVTFDVLM